MENERLYIPIGIKVEEEIFPGINKADLINLIVTGMFLNLINLFLYFFIRAAALQTVIGLFIFGLSYFLWNKDHTNVSIANSLSWMIKYGRSNKVWKYIYQEEIKYE